MGDTAVIFRELRERLAGVPEVESAVGRVEDGELDVWVYLDAEPYDRAPRYRVYEIEQELLRGHPSLALAFHVRNLPEFSPAARDGIRVPGQAIYERGNGANG